MKFRLATEDDVPFILELMREFHVKNGAVFHIPFDDGSTVQTILKSIQEGFCLVGPASCAGVVFEPNLFNHNHTMAVVLFWYFRAAREIAIFDAVLKAVEGRPGIDSVVAVAIQSGRAIQKRYAKRGLIPVETVCMKVMKPNG